MCRAKFTVLHLENTYSHPHYHHLEKSVLCTLKRTQKISVAEDTDKCALIFISLSFSQLLSTQTQLTKNWGLPCYPTQKSTSILPPLDPLASINTVDHYLQLDFLHVLGFHDTAFCQSTHSFKVSMESKAPPLLSLFLLGITQGFALDPLCLSKYPLSLDDLYQIPQLSVPQFWKPGNLMGSPRDGMCLENSNNGIHLHLSTPEISPSFHSYIFSFITYCHLGFTTHNTTHSKLNPWPSFRNLLSAKKKKNMTSLNIHGTWYFDSSPEYFFKYFF